MTTKLHDLMWDIAESYAKKHNAKLTFVSIPLGIFGVKTSYETYETIAFSDVTDDDIEKE